MMDASCDGQSAFSVLRREIQVNLSCAVFTWHLVLEWSIKIFLLIHTISTILCFDKIHKRDAAKDRRQGSRAELVISRHLLRSISYLSS